jgi:hypothetical protein
MRDLNTEYSRGQITLKALSVESQRIEIQRHSTLCLALSAASGDEVPALLVVLVNNGEIMKVLPDGELSEGPLKPNYVYETEQGGEAVVFVTSQRDAGATASDLQCSPASRDSRFLRVHAPIFLDHERIGYYKCNV